MPDSKTSFFAHNTSCIDDGAKIGDGTNIWHFCHVCSGAIIGKQCNLGQNVFIAGGVIIGNNVKIQNNVSAYAGLIVEDDVFLGPSCVLTNISNPRSQINRRKLYEKTILRRGCTIGANATIVCGSTVGRYALIAAGATVTHNVPDYALVMGCPAKQVGWVSRHGHRLQNPDSDGIMICPESGMRYRTNQNGNLINLDLDEEITLPEGMCTGKKSYREFKQNSISTDTGNS